MQGGIRIDPGSEAPDMVMSIFGGMSKGERMRIEHRVRGGIAAQAAGEGRFLGGRPPYGYRLVDAVIRPSGDRRNPGQPAWAYSTCPRGDTHPEYTDRTVVRGHLRLPKRATSEARA